MKKLAVIVAGGTGSRMNTGIPKQFIPLGGMPLLSYSIHAFHNADPETEIIVVLPKGFSDQWQKLVQETRLDIEHQFIDGGHERFFSVRNALNYTHYSHALIAVHDAARPFASTELINHAFAYAAQFGNAVPAVSVKDSLRMKVMDEWIVADRNLFRAIQTPQVFQLEALKKAYLHPFKPRFTDDASVFEDAGNAIQLIPGEEKNFKITTPADFEFAEFLVSKNG